jgi:hypothetical protein
MGREWHLAARKRRVGDGLPPRLGRVDTSDVDQPELGVWPERTMQRGRAEPLPGRKEVAGVPSPQRRARPPPRGTSNALMRVTRGRSGAGGERREDRGCRRLAGVTSLAVERGRTWRLLPDLRRRYALHARQGRRGRGPTRQLPGGPGVPYVPSLVYSRARPATGWPRPRVRPRGARAIVARERRRSASSNESQPLPATPGDLD